LNLLLKLWYLMIAGVILISLFPRPQDFAIEGDDKAGHFLAYVLLAIPPALAFLRAKHIALAAAGLVLLGIVIENLQQLIPGRGFEYGDIAANTAGVCLGMLIGLTIRKLRAPAPQPAGD
jgi:VanZ family protein